MSRYRDERFELRVENWDPGSKIYFLKVLWFLRSAAADALPLLIVPLQMAAGS